MKFEITTLGCKVNEYESVYYAQQLEALGMRAATENEPADVVVINTCTVTNTAARKSRQKIRRARKLNPDALCVVVGCYAQTMEEEARADLQADLLIGAAHKNELAAQVSQALEQRKAAGHQNLPDSGSKQKDELSAGADPAGSAAKAGSAQTETVSLVRPIEEIHDFEAMPIGSFEGQHRAFLKIQDGCNQYCAYCQIPLARGPERSQIPADIVKVARNLAEKGHREIVLTGIHTGRYHFRGDNLTSLLKMLLEELPEDVCFRISSIEITEVSDELLELMAANPRILPHMHIPIQAGCDGTLARMKRPYTIEQFEKRLEKIRSMIPDISISTDVITGFVQESDEEFETTRANLERLGFSFLHVFPYSRRKGTAADAMSGFVDSAVAKKRTDELLALSARLRRRDMERFDTLSVLVERPGNVPGTWSGYSQHYHPVLIQSDTPLSGRVQVKVVSVDKGVYNARRINEEN